MHFAPQNQLTLVSSPLAVMDSQYAKNSAAIKLQLDERWGLMNQPR